MHVLKCFEKLVDDVFFMYFLKYPCPYHNMEISFHKIKHQVKIFIILGFDDVEESYDVIVTVELLQKHDFAECSLSISCIMKGVEYFFEGYDPLELAIDGLPHDTVCAFAKLLYDFVFFENVRLDLFSHCYRKYL